MPTVTRSTPPTPPALPASRRGARVLGIHIDALDDAQTVGQITRWATARESRAVYLCNAHSLVTARQVPRFAAALQGADLAMPDGAPVAWMLRRLGFPDQGRVSGPDLMLRVCERLQQGDITAYLYGSTEATLARLAEQLREHYPGLRIAGAFSPPFGEPSAALDAEHAAAINASGAGVVFVGLGCPKQELWIDRQRGAVQAVMLGVGAAFDFHAGTLPRAPQWMQDKGLEWLHRLASEPRRLWRRYLVTNTRFVIAAARQLLRRRGAPAA